MPLKFVLVSSHISSSFSIVQLYLLFTSHIITTKNNYNAFIINHNYSQLLKVGNGRMDLAVGKGEIRVVKEVQVVTGNAKYCRLTSEIRADLD